LSLIITPIFCKTHLLAVAADRDCRDSALRLSGPYGLALLQHTKETTHHLCFCDALEMRIQKLVGNDKT